MKNEDRTANDAEQRETSIRFINEQSLRNLRQGAQQRLDVALLRCCQEWFSAPAKKKKEGSAPTLLGLCTKWWREVKEILLWRAQPSGVRVEVSTLACAESALCVCNVKCKWVNGSVIPYPTCLLHSSGLPHYNLVTGSQILEPTGSYLGKGEGDQLGPRRLQGYPEL